MSLSANSIRILEAKFGKDAAREVVTLLNQSAGSAGTTYTQTYATASRTQSNPTAAALTVADGAGTNDGTIGAITGDASVIAAVQELAAQINALRTDLLNVKQVLNGVIDDLQTAQVVG